MTENREQADIDWGEYGMRTCFVDYPTRSIADLTDYYGRGLMITRINVPEKSRGQGIGSKLLKEICAEADKTKTTLWLEILASGGLSHDELRDWYLRYDFKDIGGIYRRKPKA